MGLWTPAWLHKIALWPTKVTLTMPRKSQKFQAAGGVGGQTAVPLGGAGLVSMEAVSHLSPIQGIFATVSPLAKVVKLPYFCKTRKPRVGLDLHVSQEVVELGLEPEQSL